MGLWATVNSAQATILSALLNIMAAIVGVILGWLLFSGKVASLRTAIDQSDKILTAHKTFTENEIGLISESLRTITESLRAITESVGTVQGRVAEIQAVQSANPESQGFVETDGAPREADDRRARLVESWDSVRARLEQIATREDIDGRTRAALARIDRRSYADLVRALSARGLLSSNEQLFVEAVAIWHQYRNGRRVPSDSDLARIQSIATQIGDSGS